MFMFILLATLFITVINAVFLAKKTKGKENKLYKSILSLHIVGMPTILAYALAISTQSYDLAYLSYSIFFCGIDWLLLITTYYVREYTQTWEDSFATSLVMTIMVITDNISLLAANIWHHAFVIDRYDGGAGYFFYVFFPTSYYTVHLTLCYILAAVIILILGRKAFCTGGIHRTRYLIILGIFLLVLLTDGIFLLFQLPIDASVIFFMIGFLMAGYCSLVYNPRAFVEYMLASLTEKMECAIIAFDENDDCIYSNQRANHLFNTTCESDFYNDWFDKWKKGRKSCDIANESWNEVVAADEIRPECHYDVHFNKIYDQKGYYCGSYFSYYDVTSDYMAYEEEKYRLSHDVLTGALNRESFYDNVKQAFVTYPNTDYVIACSNIKGFKLINDIFGLDVADSVLIKIAEVIREHIRAGSIYARLEADRFAVLLPKDRFSEELFRDGMREIENLLNNTQYKMAIHVGVYEVYDKSLSVASMCDRAFLAIDSIKDSFKVDIAYYGDAMRHDYMCEQKIIAEFETALARGEFAMFLQPLVSPDDSVTLAEALVRWVSPEKGIVPPVAFIPILERTGYIYKLDRFIWEQAAKRLALWRATGHEDNCISVNISVKDFYYINIYDTLVSIVEKYDIDPSHLKLEITESVFMTETSRQLEIINTLIDYGFVIEIDDFGSGYSSLNMLKEVPASILKLDMAFLSVTKNTDKSRKIVDTIIALAKALDMKVVVEGVETKEQVDYLRGVGTDYLQGYYFDKPITVNQFEKKYL